MPTVDTRRSGTLEKTTNVTWVLKINKDTWELFSVDGLVLKDQLKPGDEMLEPRPLTTTDTSYTLVPSEKVNRQTDDVSSVRNSDDDQPDNRRVLQPRHHPRPG